MRKYLETIHKRPEAHKKRFALLVSGCFTILIFGIWFMAKAGGEGHPVSTGTPGVQVPGEFSPFQSLKASASAAAKIFFNDFEKIEKGLETVHKKYGE